MYAVSVGTWAQTGTTPANNYAAMSSTGQYLIGGGWTSAGTGVNIAVSSNFGSSSQSSSLNYLAYTTVSPSGQYMLASTNGDGNVYLSNDYGATWSSKSLACYWSAAARVAISGTGQYMAAASNTYAGSTCGATGYFYVSSDFGQSWSSRSTAKCWTQIAFVSVSASVAPSGVMIVATGGNIDGGGIRFNGGTGACSETGNAWSVLRSLDLGLTWLTLFSIDDKSILPGFPEIPGGAVNTLPVYYKMSTSDANYTVAMIDPSTTALQGTSSSPYALLSASVDLKVFATIDKGGNLRLTGKQSWWRWSAPTNPQPQPVSGTCTFAWVSGDGQTVMAACGSVVYKGTGVTVAGVDVINALPPPSAAPTYSAVRRRHASYTSSVLPLFITLTSHINSPPSPSLFLSVQSGVGVSALPSGQPSTRPTKFNIGPRNPTSQPTEQPTGQPSEQPSTRPTGFNIGPRNPTGQPTSRPTRLVLSPPSAALRAVRVCVHAFVYAYACVYAPQRRRNAAAACSAATY